MSEIALSLFREIAAAIPDARPGKMFGAECFSAPNGKAVCFFYKGDMVFKLTGEHEREALSLDGTHLFGSGGRTKSGWIQVSFDYHDQWHNFAKAAMAYVKNLPSNVKEKQNENGQYYRN